MIHILHQWATDHRLPPAAIADLMQRLGASDQPHSTPADASPGSETRVQQETSLLAPKLGMMLWRNNVGACVDDRGNHIRYGLANESKQENEKIKSSDLIGITPVTCQCGRTYGVFTALEVKRAGWKLSPGDARAMAQLNYGRIVISKGGIFRFINDKEQIR